jgi:hypothetical protein
MLFAALFTYDIELFALAPLASVAKDAKCSFVKRGEFRQPEQDESSSFRRGFF